MPRRWESRRRVDAARATDFARPRGRRERFAPRRRVALRASLWRLRSQQMPGCDMPHPRETRRLNGLSEVPPEVTKANDPDHGEGHRKVWARLRCDGGHHVGHGPDDDIHRRGSGRSVHRGGSFHRRMCRHPCECPGYTDGISQLERADDSAAQTISPTRIGDVPDAIRRTEIDGVAHIDGVLQKSGQRPPKTLGASSGARGIE